MEFVGCGGGTFTGVARALKKELPQIKCYQLEPQTGALKVSVGTRFQLGLVC